MYLGTRTLKNIVQTTGRNEKIEKEQGGTT